jgi:hypothetical protein
MDRLLHGQLISAGGIAGGRPLATNLGGVRPLILARGPGAVPSAPAPVLGAHLLAEHLVGDELDQPLRI